MFDCKQLLFYLIHFVSFMFLRFMTSVQNTCPFCFLPCVLSGSVTPSWIYFCIHPMKYWWVPQFAFLVCVCVCVCPMKNHQRRVIGLNTNNYPEPCSEEAAGTGYTVPTNNLAYVWTRKVFWMDEVYYSTAIELVLTSRYTLWVYLLAHSSV